MERRDPWATSQARHAAYGPGGHQEGAPPFPRARKRPTMQALGFGAVRRRPGRGGPGRRRRGQRSEHASTLAPRSGPCGCAARFLHTHNHAKRARTHHPRQRARPPTLASPLVVMRVTTRDRQAGRGREGAAARTRVCGWSVGTRSSPSGGPLRFSFSAGNGGTRRHHGGAGGMGGQGRNGGVRGVSRTSLQNPLPGRTGQCGRQTINYSMWQGANSTPLAGSRR